MEGVTDRISGAEKVVFGPVQDVGMRSKGGVRTVRCQNFALFPENFSPKIYYSGKIPEEFPSDPLQ